MRVSVAVALAGGATAVKHFSLTYDAIAPQFSPPALMMEDDSGLSDQDNVTNIINPRLTVFAEPGSLLEVRLNELSLVREVAAGTWTSQLPLAADGVVDVFARATDVAGNVSEPLFPTRITLDTTSPTAVNLRLSPSSDTGARGEWPDKRRSSHSARLDRAAGYRFHRRYRPVAESFDRWVWFSSPMCP